MGNVLQNSNYYVTFVSSRSAPTKHFYIDGNGDSFSVEPRNISDNDVDFNNEERTPKWNSGA